MEEFAKNCHSMLLERRAVRFFASVSPKRG
jgi:hypothetical protein